MNPTALAKLLEQQAETLQSLYEQFQQAARECRAATEPNPVTVHIRQQNQNLAEQNAKLTEELSESADALKAANDKIEMWLNAGENRNLADALKGTQQALDFEKEKAANSAYAVQDLTKQRNHFEEQLKSSNAENQRLRDENTELKAKVNDVQIERKRMNEQLDFAKSNRTKVVEDAQDLQKSFTDLRELHANQRETIEEQQAEIDKLKTERAVWKDGLCNANKRLTKERDEAIAEAEALDAQLAESQAEVIMQAGYLTHIASVVNSHQGEPCESSEEVVARIVTAFRERAEALQQLEQHRKEA